MLGKVDFDWGGEQIEENPNHVIVCFIIAIYCQHYSFDKLRRIFDVSNIVHNGEKLIVNLASTNDLQSNSGQVDSLLFESRYFEVVIVDGQDDSGEDEHSKQHQTDIEGEMLHLEDVDLDEDAVE